MRHALGRGQDLDSCAASSTESLLLSSVVGGKIEEDGGGVVPQASVFGSKHDPGGGILCHLSDSWCSGIRAWMQL